MEKVQFQLEATLPELKDLHEKGLFSRHEIDQITKRRTHLETSLIKKGVKKEDFFKYAEYEINLEKLRKVRWKRLGYDKNPPPPSASLFSIPRRIMYILKRATAKFPGDLATWLAYVEYAGREGMRKIVSKGLTSALQHHPLSPTLYLLSSFHHVHPGSPFPHSSIPSTSTLDLPSSSTQTPIEESEETQGGFALEGTQPARTTLLLGLRMLPSNPELWREYIKLELAWVEALRRRWKVLGITNTSRPAITSGEDAGEGSFGPDGEDARKAILAGQLVLQAIKSALSAIPVLTGKTPEGLDFRSDLLNTLRTYPSPLRSTCLDVVYADLDRIAAAAGQAGAQAKMVLMTRKLYDRPYEAGLKEDGGVVLTGVELVEALGEIGKEVRKAAKKAGKEFGEVAGEWLDERMKENEANSDLVAYLLSVLSSLTKPSLNPSPSLLLLHLRHTELCASPTEYTDLAAKYANSHPGSARLQLAHLQAEVDSNADIAHIRTSAEKMIKSFDQSQLSEEGKQVVGRIWTTWIGHEVSSASTKSALEPTWTKVLRLSLGSSGSAEIHNDILVLYFDWLVSDTAVIPISALRKINSSYRPNPLLFSHVLSYLISISADLQEIIRLHESWRAACKTDSDKIDEGIQIAETLLRRGKAAEAMKIVEVTKVDVKGRDGAGRELERRWKAVLDGIELEREEGDDEEEEGEDDDDTEEAEEEVEDGEEGGVGVSLNLDDDEAADVSMDATELVL